MPSVTRTIHFEKTQERYELTASPACVHLDGGGNQTETVTVRLMHYKGKESDEITGKSVTITDGANSANFTLPAEINQSGSTVISRSLDDREHGAPDSLTVIGILGANNLVIPVVHDGAAGENAVTVQTSPEAILHKKATTSSQYSLAIRVWNGKTAVPASGFSAKIQSKPNGLSEYMIASATYSYINYLGISINANTEINGDITIAVTYNGNTYTKVVPFKTVVNGDHGIKGEKGASLRGPQAWSDLSVGYQFYQGKDGEEYKDIVLYNGNFYSCIKTHVKSATNYPGGTEDTSNGYWKVSENFELIATKVFFAKLAQIDNLEIGDHINIKDKNGVIVLVANKDGLTCKQGTFENVQISGELNGVTGTFKKLQALDEDGNEDESAAIYMTGKAGSTGRFRFSGNMDNMGLSFYGGNIFSTGAEFGVRGRGILFIRDNYCELLYTGRPYIPLRGLTSFTESSVSFYRVPLFNIDSIYTLANKAIDVVVFNCSKSGFNYQLFADCIGKGVDIINANDDIYVNIASQAGWYKLEGGVSMRGVYIGNGTAGTMGVNVINPKKYHIGAGWFFFGEKDFNW